MSRTPVLAANWKMHKTIAEAEAFVAGLLPRVADVENVDVALCVPFTALQAVVDSTRGSRVEVYAQNMHEAAEGAFTGEVSAAMLAEFACRYVIVGHSERRALHGESDGVVAEKAARALAAGLTPIVCVGETLAERESGRTDAVVARQLGAAIEKLGDAIGDTVIAYEPVWAIGTGKTASPAEAEAVHAQLRGQLATLNPRAAAVSILYGGSVKPDNAAALFSQSNIDGGLIGGASLKVADFAAICLAAAH